LTLVDGRLAGEMKVVDLLISSMRAQERGWLRRPILVKGACSRPSDIDAFVVPSG